MYNSKSYSHSLEDYTDMKEHVAKTCDQHIEKIIVSGKFIFQAAHTARCFAILHGNAQICNHMTIVRPKLALSE